jgi:flagellar motility protein MotE (MotC chaperone)
VKYLRILPITIFTAALLLTVKLNSIWDVITDPDYGKKSATVSVASAVAQQETPASAQQPAADAQQSPEGTPPPAIQPRQSAAPPIAPVDPGLSTLNLTQTEIDTLQQLSARREELEQRERQINRRQDLLSAAETRIDKKIQELKELQNVIDNLIVKHDDQQLRELRRAVKTYETMKPKDAAAIFDSMEMDTLLSITEQMREAKLAPIMAAMQIEKAKELTVQLLEKRRLPEPGGSGDQASTN